MARTKGTFPIAKNYEVLQKAPLDARLIVSNISDLVNPTTWRDAANLEWLYTGMPVSVIADPTYANNGLWFLLDEETYTSPSSWVKVGSELLSDASGTTWQTFQLNNDENGVVLKDSSGNLEVVQVDGSTYANVRAGTVHLDALKFANLSGVLYAVDGSVYAEPNAKPILVFDASIIGDNSTKVFSITHNLGTKKQNTTVWDITNDLLIQPGIKKGTNINTITFFTAPAVSENYNVNIMGFD
jgi:hypothetical protein